MASARPTVMRIPSVISTAAAVVASAVGGVKATRPPTFVGSAVEVDDLCNCGHDSGASHKGAAAVCRYAGACGCVGFTPR